MTLTRRLAAAALAGAAAVTTAVVAAPPAQALIRCGSDPFQFCAVLIDRGGLMPPPECFCEMSFVLDPADRLVYDRVDVLINRGVYDLRLSGRVADRTERARLQRVGTDLLAQAMQLVSVVPTAGPLPDPWAQVAGRDLSVGLRATFDAQRTRDAVAARALQARATEAFRSFAGR